MLHLHHADRLEPLLDALAAVLATAPADPFTADVVAVPAAGLRDAAMVGLGRRLGASADGAGDGISANVEFLFPGRFMARALGDTTRADDPEGDPWRLPRLTWTVLEELAVGDIEVPGRADADQWVLARRIADLFDRYATQRPRLVECWATGTDSDGTFREDGTPAWLEPAHRWQAELWRAVRARVGTPSPPERLPELLDLIRTGEVSPQLPERVAVFGVGSVAPTMQQLLIALGAQREVHVFLRHPSMEAWKKSPHRLAGGLNVRTNVDVTIAASNPLLASWGRPALEARALLNDLRDVRFEAHGAPPATPPRSLLEALQQSVRTDTRPVRTAVRADDGSFQVHACHGEMRQLETLRDALGHAFVADPTLQPHEVLVLCPDLDRFAPLVEAVFARGPLPVPVRVGDRSLTTDEPIIDALQAVLTLVAGRATLSEVLSLVQYQPVRRRFGWSMEDVEQIAEWSVELGARWGLVADHRTPWGVPADVDTGTWRTTVDQLLAGMALSAPTPRVVLGGTAPYDQLATGDFALVGSIADLLARLLALHDAVQGARPVAEWIDLLHGVVDEFCAEDPDEPWRRQSVHRELTDILRAARATQAQADADIDATCAVPLTLSDVRAVLVDSLSERPGRLPLRSGSVTVSSMVPQHGVPARVVCLLGLDDGALRGGTFDGDDVLGLRPCVGERHPRHENRQLLLDAVLGAADRVIITCNGADLTTNKAVPYVVPLVELLDAVGDLVELDRHRAPVVVRHPRHGFNERALVPGALLPGVAAPFTFDTSMLAAAEARRRAEAVIGEPTASPWVLAPSPLGAVDIDRLADVVANPSRLFLQRRLEVSVPEDADALEDGLSITVDPLGMSRLGGNLLATRRRGGMPDDWAAVARLQGALPPGELSATAIAQVQSEVALLEVHAAQWGIPLTGTDELQLDQTLIVDIAGTPTEVVLQGRVRGVVARPGGFGVADMRFARPRPSYRLALALRMAAAQRQRPEGDWSAVLLTRAAYNAKPVPLGMRLRGTGSVRQANAERLLGMAVQLLEWANRDAVPLFDRASEQLALDRVNDMFQKLTSDVRDRFVSVLWPEVSGEALLRDPLLDTDPAFLSPFAHLSRATAVATWVWSTFDATVELVDEHGQPVAGAVDGGEPE